jgi:RNA polymerase sigma-70 factor (ECF subfamily)
VSRDPLAYPEPLIRRVYAYVAYRIGDGADAEDVTSDVFERAVRYRKSYDRRKGEPAAWLIGIARRSIDSHLAARAPSAGEVPDIAATDDLEETTAERIDLVRVLATLDDRDRELLALRYGADLSARQIAELLEQRTNTVEVALHRALARLRRAIERDDPATAAETSVLKPEVSR